MLSCVWLFVTPWTEAYYSSDHGILQQEYWSGLPFPSPGDLLDPGVEPRSPALQADCLPSEPPGKPPNPYMLLIEIPIEDCGRRGQWSILWHIQYFWLYLSFFRLPSAYPYPYLGYMAPRLTFWRVIFDDHLHGSQRLESFSLSFFGLGTNRFIAGISVLWFNWMKMII